MIQRECLYASTLWNEDERGLAVALYLAYYNAERPHTAIDGLSPERWLRRWDVTRVYGDFT
jgi:transposase InsO family protein